MLHIYTNVSRLLYTVKTIHSFNIKLMHLNVKIYKITLAEMLASLARFGVSSALTDKSEAIFISQNKWSEPQLLGMIKPSRGRGNYNVN